VHQKSQTININSTSKNFLSERNNYRKTKIFGVLPDIRKKNPLIKSTLKNCSTMNTTKNNNIDTCYIQNNQNSTIILDNNTKGLFNNKNTFFSNTKNTYGNFIVPSSNFDKKVINEKRLDSTEINESLDKTNLITKDMNNSNFSFMRYQFFY